MALTDVKSEQIQSSVALAGSPTTTTQSASDNSTKIATTAYVETAVANLVASAPAALNTLDELAAALNDDASFSTTVTNSIATKLPLAGGTLTGNLTTSGNLLINAASGNPYLSIKTAGTGNNPYVEYRAGNNIVFDNMLVASASTDYWRVGYGASGTVTSEYLTVTSGGNVGINTNIPAYPLHIEGSNVSSGGGLATLGVYDTGTAYNGTNPGGGVTFRGKYNTAGALTNFATVQGIKENTTDGNYASALRFTTRANGANLTEQMRIDSSGNVGIGTSDPASLIHGMAGDLFLTANSTSADSGQGVYFQSTTNGWNTPGAHAAILGKRTDGSNGYLRFDTRQSGTTQEAMRIDSSGNVNIGAKDYHSHQTTVDSLQIGYALNLYEDSYTSGTLNYAVWANNSYYSASGGNKYMRNDEASRLMQYDGNLSFQNAAAGTADNAVTFADRFFIKANGNVGIGNTNPAGLLTIRGTGDAIRVESTNAGAGGAQLDLLHHTASPADNDTPGAVNFGGYYSGTTPAYSAAIRSIWTDVSGREGKLALLTRNGSNFNEQMVVDHLGRVRKPYQPYFQAFRSGSQSGYNASGNFASVVIYNNATINVGGHYNASTGYFTAPVEGIYIFFAAAYITGWSAGQSWFSSTSGRLSGTDIVYSSSKTFPEASIIIKMGANDTVGFHPYASNTTNATILANANHTFFRGYFLG